jgi:uncharacterized membrane protein YfhO
LVGVKIQFSNAKSRKNRYNDSIRGNMNKLKNLFKKIKIYIDKSELLKVTIYLFTFVFLTFAIQSVPNGLTLPMNGDYVLQQLHFYYEGYDAYWTFFTTGEFPLWSYRGFLGVNYFAANTFYYLTSPFMLLMLLVPRFLIPQMIFITYMIKLVVGGLLVFVLLRKYFNNSYYGSLIGAVAYALSGWGMYYLWFNHFADVLALLPLIFIGVEHLLKYRKGYLLAISLFLMGLANYFFLFGFVILMFFYSIFRYLMMFKVNRGYNLKILLIGGLYYLTGIMMVAFVLVPAFNVIGANPRVENSNLLIELLSFFFVSPSRVNGALILSSLKPVGEILSGSNLGGLLRYLFVFAERYSGEVIPSLQTQLYPIATFLFPPVNNWDSLVFSNKFFDNTYSSLYISLALGLMLVPTIIKLIKSKKIIVIIATIILLVLPFTPFVYYLMGAFSQFYGRWQLFLVLIMIIAIVPQLENFDKIPDRWLDISALILVGSMIGVSLYSYTIGKIGYNFGKQYGIIAIIVLMILMYVYLRFFFKKKFSLENLLYIVTIDLLIAGNVTQIGHGVSSFWQLFGGRAVFNEHQTIINDLNREDPSFYRIFVDLADRNNNNLSLSLGYKGISTFHSIYSFGLYEFLNDWSKVPYSYGNWSMGVDEKRVYLDSYLNVKYYVLPKDDTNIPYGYSMHREYPNFTVYINDYHVELGYAFDAVVNRQNFNVYFDYFQHEYYYNKFAIVNNDDFSELKSILGNDVEVATSNLILPFQQVNFFATTIDLYLRGVDEPIRVNDDLYFAGNYLPPERNGKFFGPFVAQNLGGDKIVVTFNNNICFNANSENVCQVVLKLNYGPNVKVSFYNQDKLIVTDSHGVSNYDKSGDQKFARSFYLNQPATRVELEFLSDADINEYIRYGVGIYFDYQNDYLQSQSKLVDNGLKSVKHSNNKIEFSTDFTSNKMIVLSVPYDEGWGLKIDGESAKIYQLNSGFIGIVGLSGNHKYELTYFTPGLATGGLISLFGLLIFLILLLLELKAKKKG